MMSILIEQLINITYAIFLGHIGEIELGASALAGIWYLAIYMLGLGFSQGLQVVIARRNGEKHYSETGKTFFQGLFFLSGLAVFLCLFFKLFFPNDFKSANNVTESVSCRDRLFGLAHLGIALLFSFPCITFVSCWHYSNESLNHSCSFRSISEHFGQLDAYISIGHGNSWCRNRIVRCRIMFIGYIVYPYSKYEQTTLWFILAIR